jgi:hypothetical protein
MKSDGLAALRLLGERLMVDDDQAAGRHCVRYSPCRSPVTVVRPVSRLAMTK